MIRVNAAQRLMATNPTLKDLINTVEDVATKHGLRLVSDHPNPREYRKPAPPPHLEEVQKEFEALGFKFRRLAAHRPGTPALEADGHYQSGTYILDLILNRDTMEVDLYY